VRDARASRARACSPLRLRLRRARRFCGGRSMSELRGCRRVGFGSSSALCFGSLGFDSLGFGSLGFGSLLLGEGPGGACARQGRGRPDRFGTRRRRDRGRRLRRNRQRRRRSRQRRRRSRQRRRRWNRLRRRRGGLLGSHCLGFLLPSLGASGPRRGERGGRPDRRPRSDRCRRRRWSAASSLDRPRGQCARLGCRGFDARGSVHRRRRRRLRLRRIRSVGSAAAAHDDGGLQMAHLSPRRAPAARGRLGGRGGASGGSTGRRAATRFGGRRAGSRVHRMGNILSAARREAGRASFFDCARARATS
jgi:hypothetical protein